MGPDAERGLIFQQLSHAFPDHVIIFYHVKTIIATINYANYAGCFIFLIIITLQNRHVIGHTIQRRPQKLRETNHGAACQ